MTPARRLTAHACGRRARVLSPTRTKKATGFPVALIFPARSRRRVKDRSRDIKP